MSCIFYNVDLKQFAARDNGNVVMVTEDNLSYINDMILIDIGKQRKIEICLEYDGVFYVVMLFINLKHGMNILEYISNNGYIIRELNKCSMTEVERVMINFWLPNYEKFDLHGTARSRVVLWNDTLKRIEEYE